MIIMLTVYNNLYFYSIKDTICFNLRFDGELLYYVHPEKSIVDENDTIIYDSRKV